LANTWRFINFYGSSVHPFHRCCFLIAQGAAEPRRKRYLFLGNTYGECVISQLTFLSSAVGAPRQWSVKLARPRKAIVYDPALRHSLPLSGLWWGLPLCCGRCSGWCPEARGRRICGRGSESAAFNHTWTAPCPFEPKSSISTRVSGCVPRPRIWKPISDKDDSGFQIRGMDPQRPASTSSHR
jgi:hypothetical protein